MSGKEKAVSYNDVITDWSVNTTYSEKLNCNRRRIMGIAAIIVSADNKILIVKEGEDKAVLDKRKGDWGVPMETKKRMGKIKLENDLKTLERLIDEETGLGSRVETACKHSNWQGDYMISVDEPIWCRVYLLFCNENSLQLQKVTDQFVAQRDEVENLTWVNPEDIFEMPRRRGIEEMVRDYVFNTIQPEGNGVYIRGKCVPGFRPNQV